MIRKLILASTSYMGALARAESYLDDKDPLGNVPHRNIDNGANDGQSLLIFLVVFFSFSCVTLLLSLCTVLIYFIKRKLALSEDELMRREENQVYLELESDEQELYFQSKDYLAENPYFRGELTLSQNLLIQEKGVSAWEFLKDPMLTNNELLILNKYEMNFFKKIECSAQTNLPIPMKNEVYYFESKIYSLPNPDATRISIGLGIRPYPWFRLPGRHAHSVSYDNDGYRRHNQPFPFDCEPHFPPLIEGDVVGIGYRVRSGTIFFTRNGKKVSESKLGGHIKHFKIPNEGQIFPIIGANNLCSVHVNLGQMGFVFIEANVKKWGFAPLEGAGPAPPAYNKFNSDILLERSEIDENEFSEAESDFPPDFWETQDENDKFSYTAYEEENGSAERITLNSLPPELPPSYESNSDADDEQSDAENEDSGLGAENAGSGLGAENAGSGLGTETSAAENSESQVENSESQVENTVSETDAAETSENANETQYVTGTEETGETDVTFDDEIAGESVKAKNANAENANAENSVIPENITENANAENSIDENANAEITSTNATTGIPDPENTSQESIH